MESGTNYIFHLMAVAGVGFESEYGERYRDTVAPDDRSWLREHREHLSFRDGRSGSLVLPAIFLPAYIGLDTADDFRDYFSRLARGATQSEAFLDRYRPFLTRLARDWLEVVDERWLSYGRGLEETLLRLGDIYAANHALFLSRAWPRERTGIADVAGHLHRHFSGRDIIGAWERFTGLTWKAERYEIVLVSAIKNGPRANSLGYERNVFYTYDDLDPLTRFISHETGTHLLIDLVKAFSFPDESGRVRLQGGETVAGYDFDLVYRGYENLCAFYNSLVLDLEGSDYLGGDYRSAEFQSLYLKLYREGARIEPLRMLLSALDELAAGA